MAANSSQQSITFDIQSHDDVSLLLFAYHAARSLSTERLYSRVPLTPHDAQALERLRAPFEPVATAFEPYLQTNLAFDRTMLFAVASTLGMEVEYPDLDLQQALNEFRPHYLSEIAPQHRAANSEFKALAEGEIALHGPAMTAAIAEVLESEWREEPIRFVVSPYASRAGAYTNSVFTVMSSTRADYRAHALEMLFHEAAHTSPIRDRLKPVANAALARHGMENSRFWHYLQFYAIGRATQHVLGKDHVPYHEETGLSSSSSSQPFYQALHQVWDQHEGLANRANAAIDLIAAEASAQAS